MTSTHLKKMTNLDTSAKAFLDACKNASIDFYLNPNSNIPAELPSSKELLHYFSTYNPSKLKLETGFSPLKFFDTESLKKAQTGYRWNAISGEPIHSWNNNDLVIADSVGGGKPIIAKCHTDETSIYASYDVAEQFKISDSLEDFFLAFSKLIPLIYEKYSVFEIVDENEDIKEEFKKDFFSEVKSIIGSENSNRLYDYLYG